METPLEMPLVSDEQPVEAFPTRGANESFGERVGTRRANRCFDDSSADRRHDFIQGTDELRVPVADQEPDEAAFVRERHHEVACLLGDPGSDRMLGDACQEDLAALKIDEEQHMEPAESNGIDAEEVAGERAGRLSSKELSPRRSRLSRSRYEPVSSKHVANARGRDYDPELLQLADDAEIAPPRILPRLSGQSWVSLWITRGGNVSAVPAISALEETDPFFLSADLGRDSFQAAAQLVDLHGETGEHARPPPLVRCSSTRARRSARR